ARGGRYDDVGAVFGEGRPATGFSADLNLLVELGGLADEQRHGGIYAPAADDPRLLAQIRRLRDDGERVVIGMAGDDGAQAHGCDRILDRSAGSWQLRTL